MIAKCTGCQLERFSVLCRYLDLGVMHFSSAFNVVHFSPALNVVFFCMAISRITIGATDSAK